MKKLLAIVLIIAHLSGYGVYGASGVFDSATLDESRIKDLHDLGIMIGDENGNLRLDDTITRAETAKMYFEEFVIGKQTKIDGAVIEKSEMIDFAGKYDNIPLHTDEEYAKSTFFGKLIAPGVMSFMSVWAKYLEIDLAGDELLAGKSTKIEWIKPVFAEDVLTSTCTVSNLTKRNARNGIVELTFEVFNQNNELVLTDVTEMIVKCRP